MVRTSKLHNFDLSDIKELFKVAAESSYSLLNGYRPEELCTSDETRDAWLKVPPKLVVGD